MRSNSSRSATWRDNCSQNKTFQGDFMQRARLTFVAAACLLATSATAATRPTDAEISDLVAKYSAAAIADREDIHKNPELSNRETRTGALIAAHLKKLGIETRTGV